MLSDELKPCPFCGSEAELRRLNPYYWAVDCTNKDCNAATMGYKDVGTAIAVWNRRVQVAVPNEVREAIICLKNFGIPLGTTSGDWKKWTQIVNEWLARQGGNDAR